MQRERVGLGVVLAATVLAAGVVAVRLLVPAQAPIDTDIMALVPQDERDPVLAAAIERSASLLGSRIGLLVRADDPKVRAAAAADLRAALGETGLLVAVEDEAAALWRWLFDHRDRLLCPADRRLLEDDQGAVLAEQALAQIYTPLVPIGGDLLRADPLLLTLRLSDCFALPGGHGGDATLIAGRLAASPYALDVQDRIEEAIASWQERHGAEGVELARAGTLFHAAAAANRARLDVAWVGGISLLATTALFLSLFGSLRAALLALVTMAVGTIGGLAACLALFTKVHALALVFGAGMTGIAVDYAIHVMVAGLALQDDGAAPGNPARTIARPLQAGVLTTLAGFACLLVSGIGLMQQIAVFAASGILLSYGFSRFVLGRLCRWPEHAPRAAVRLAVLGRRLLGWSAGPALLVSLIVVAAAILWLGLARLVVSDDVRRFQPPPAGLLAEEAAVAAASGERIEPRFLLVRETGPEALRAAEAKAIAGLGQPLPAPAWLDPPESQQAADRQLIERQLLQPQLGRVAGVLGLDPATLYPDRAPDDVLPSPFAELRGEIDGTGFSIVPLAPEDRRRVVEAPPAAADLVDPAAVYGQLLGRFRQHASWALALALAVCGMGLLVTYRRLSSLRLLVPAALAVALVPAIASLAGQTLSLFSVMGLFVALGVGIDFAVFQAIDHGAAVSARHGWRQAGILAAAITTIVPMAVLASSDTLPVRHFGLAVALGIALGLILSPLARRRRAVTEEP